MIELTIPGVPVSQPRIKAFARGGHAGVYTPTKTPSGKSNGVAEFKALVKKIAAETYTGAPIATACRVDVVFVFPRQAAKVWKTKPMPRYPRITKPDRDNLDKAVLDSLTGVVLKDDNVAFDGRITKWHAAGDEQPHTTITITETPPAPAG